MDFKGAWFWSLPTQILLAFVLFRKIFKIHVDSWSQPPTGLFSDPFPSLLQWWISCGWGSRLKGWSSVHLLEPAHWQLQTFLLNSLIFLPLCSTGPLVSVTLPAQELLESSLYFWRLRECLSHRWERVNGALGKSPLLEGPWEEMPGSQL